MPGRRRFGVSIPEELARQLDEIASRLNVDRSRLVAQALETFIHDHLHLARRHHCSGVLVVVGGGPSGARVRELIENHMDVIQGHVHAHLNGACVDLLLVSGDSERIASLARSLSSIPGCRTRYIPLSVGVAPEGRGGHRG